VVDSQPIYIAGNSFEEGHNQDSFDEANLCNTIATIVGMSASRPARGIKVTAKKHVIRIASFRFIPAPQYRTPKNPAIPTGNVAAQSVKTAREIVGATRSDKRERAFKPGARNRGPSP
jgi:hypothetical protein